jgi:hypothetical protein
MNPFDIIKILLSGSKEQWDNIPKYDKEKNFFIINKTLSIRLPQIANFFNITSIPKDVVLDCLFHQLNNKMGRDINWIYTKTKKQDDKSSKIIELKKYSKEEIDAYCRYYNCSIRDFNDALNLFPKDVDSEIQNVNKIYNSKD